MAVDRAKRELFAGKLAALKRGETTTGEMRALASELSSNEDHSTDTLAYAAIMSIPRLLRDCTNDGRLMVSQSDWEKMRRWIAILHTDIDWDAPDEETELSSIRGRERRVLVRAIVGILYLFAAFLGLIVLSAVFNAILPAWLAVASVVALYVAVRMIILTPGLRDVEQRSPFRTTDAMIIAMPLVDAHALPEFNETLHGLSAGTSAMRIAKLGCALVSFAVIAGAFWPLTLLANLADIGNTSKRLARTRRDAITSVSS